MTQKLESLHLEVISDAVSDVLFRQQDCLNIWIREESSGLPDVSPAGPAGLDQRQVGGGNRGPGSEAPRETGE